MMQYRHVVIDGRYGFRARAVPGTRLVEVQVVEKVDRSHRIKVRHLGGSSAGLEEYVQPGSLVVEWHEHRAFLRDEERAKLVKAASRGAPDPVRRKAVDWVLGSAGEADADGLGGSGELVAEVEAVRRIAARAAVAEPVEDLHPLAFVDRLGWLHLPYAGVEQLARNFAVAEPQTVLLHVDGLEAELRAEGHLPGGHPAHDLLRRWRPSMALARQWAGSKKELEELRTEIEHLHAICGTAVEALRRVGSETEARRVEQALLDA